jgi:hypothetical protein
VCFRPLDTELNPGTRHQKNSNRIVLQLASAEDSNAHEGTSECLQASQEHEN